MLVGQVGGDGPFRDPGNGTQLRDRRAVEDNAGSIER